MDLQKKLEELTQKMGKLQAEHKRGQEIMMGLEAEIIKTRGAIEVVNQLMADEKGE